MSTPTADRGCSHWVGSDTKGHRCGKPLDRLTLCAQHYQVELRRLQAKAAKDADRVARAESAWRAKHVPLLPQMRIQLERAQAEYDRRTQSAVADRAAYGGKTHNAVTRSQGRLLSDSNVARVIELQKLIERLTKDIARAQEGAS